MPKRTPKRDLLEAHTGSLFPTDVVARNLRAYRRAQELSQEDVGRRMSICGHDWSAGIVGFVERGDRNVTVDELVALAVVLGRPLPALLDPTVDPTGLEGRLELGLDFPGHDIASAPLPAQVAAQFVRGDAVLRFRTENPPTFEMTKADAEDERLHELPEHGSKGWLGLGGLPEEIDKEFAARASSVIEEWKALE
jgi:transcriptional regulator with XRE-family HTH domain